MIADRQGRSALVTGAARGIGKGITQALAAEGVAVMIGDILDDVGEATAAELRSSGAKAGFVKLDVTSDADWQHAIDETIRQFGGLDIVVNNAGVEVTSLVADIDAAAARHMCDVNIVGTALGMKHAFRAMRPDGPAGKGGVILNVASVAATIAFPAIAVYSATKAAVDRMTRVAAMEAGKLGYAVRVNAIYPGLIPTEMGLQLASDIVAVGLANDVNAAVADVIGQTPLGRLAEVEDIAKAAAFLCSDSAGFITGVGLPVDGGMGM